MLISGSAAMGQDARNAPSGMRSRKAISCIDVAGFVVSQKHPQKANLDKDFPARLQKPIDTPYGPYADGFSAEQHRFGPFGPIRARVKQLAAASRTANAGGPDNTSYEPETPK
jgi:hypothetical protein